MLDLGLLFPEICMVDSLLIQEPLEETESRWFSSPSCGGVESPCLAIDHLLTAILSLLSVRVVRGRWCMTGGRVAGEGFNSGCKFLESGVFTAEVVYGRSSGDDEPCPTC